METEDVPFRPGSTDLALVEEFPGLFFHPVEGKLNVWYLLGNKTQMINFSVCQ